VLKNYIYQQAWQQTQHARGKFQFGLLWQSLMNLIYQQKLNSNSYITDTVKHLLGIAARQVPAMAPVVDGEENLAPMKIIQQAFIESYQLKNYWPQVMAPAFLNKETSPIVYYSLNFPTLLEGPAYNNKASTIRADLKDVKLHMDTIFEKAQHNYNLLENKTFQYFHTQADKEDRIHSSNELPKFDARLLALKETYSQHSFCYSSSLAWAKQK
jgi:hypothetical protein